MPIAKEKKLEVISGFKKHASDTGSPEVQIALLTTRIENLSEHFKKHKKDYHSRVGLLMLVNKRRTLLSYVKATNNEKYHELITKLGLRK
ncbi:MAG: 30S ribosomal protein S15 [Candidatus Omnitrophica bacterium]|nr:30S ribosomal protein S15 [Candidatus Omnitrophota bacterium]